MNYRCATVLSTNPEPPLRVKLGNDSVMLGALLETLEKLLSNGVNNLAVQCYPLAKLIPELESR